MALSTLAKEQENFLRYAILIVDHTKEALQDVIELNLKNKHLTFEKFLNENKHEIYHLCYDFRCCQCLKPPTKRKRLIIPPQLELLFDKYNKLPSHKGTGHNDFCCSYAKVGITSQVLDLSLARCLLVNCCLDVFWYMCLTAQGQTLEQFLNSNKHVIYHLWKNNQKCCQCPPGFIFPRDVSIITENEWRDMFNSVLLPCFEDRKRTSTETTSVCSVAARPGIDVKDIHPEIQGLILKWCCSVSDSVEKLVEFRNINFGHVTNAKLSDANFNDFFKKTKEWILTIACICGKELEVKNAINNLRYRPLDARLCSHYQNILLENINRNETISQNVILEHQKTRENISSTLSKFEERIESLEISSIEIKAKVQGLQKLITDNSKRSQLLHQTLAEIEIHERNDKYVEVGAVRHCVQLLESRNVVVLSGREGSGKSSNGLEILRQIKGKNRDFDIFRLIGLHYVFDIVKRNVTSIILFDDAFDTTSEQFSYNKNMLDYLYSYIRQSQVKIIFTMKNTVKHANKKLITTHILFHGFVDIDLNSEKFKLTKVEKEKMFTYYCNLNRIMISEREMDETGQSVSIDADRNQTEAIQTVPDQAIVVLKREIMNEIIETDPFLGFPECCRIFTETGNITALNVSCFKWPSNVLVLDIEKLRMEGKDNYINGLKYVILIYLLTFGKSDISKTVCELDDNDISAMTCKHIYNKCYNMNVEVRTSDIEYVCKLLTGRYLVNKDKTYCFQHKSIQDSVLISYSKINPKAIIPLLSFDHMVDLVRPKTYMEEEDEIVIKISKAYYTELAKRIIFLMNSFCSYNSRNLDKLEVSKIIIENDVDLIYQMILYIHNDTDSLLSWLSSHMSTFIINYFPLYLLRNIGKLDDNMLTVNHIEYQMFMSVIIGNKHVTFTVNPKISLVVAFRSKNKDIAKWLLKNTDHSMLDFNYILLKTQIYSAPEYIQLFLENVKHDLIDMTKLLINVCYACYKQEIYIVDWMMDNVDNSLIDYNKCIQQIIIFGNYSDLILHILKKANSKWLDKNKVFKACLKYEGRNILEWVQHNLDYESFEKEELLAIMIDNHEQNKTYHYDNDMWIYEKHVEQIILKEPGLKCCNINRLVHLANKKRWYGILEMFFKHDIDRSFNKEPLIEYVFEQELIEIEPNTEDDCCENSYVEMFDEAHSKKICQFIRKYYLDKIFVHKIIEKACKDGFVTPVRELLSDKVDNIPYYLGITLEKLQRQQLNDDFNVCFDGVDGQILLLLLQNLNMKCFDLNSVMNDLCRFGHSPAVLWLLEKHPVYPFDMKYVMNKACYLGDLKLVDYLHRKYNQEDFDYNTAMLKACRNAQLDTLPVCKWLWKNIDRGVFNMNAALKNASRWLNSRVIKWILTDVDAVLIDTKSAVFVACEHSDVDTVKLLLDTFCMNMQVFQYAITLACRNESSNLCITQLLYKRADKTFLDINTVLSDACKYYRYPIVEWIIKTCDQNINAIETNDGNKIFIKSVNKNPMNISKAITCILDMDCPMNEKWNLDKAKKHLLLLILEKTNLRTIDIHKILTESCKRDWLVMFKVLVGKAGQYILNIREAVDVACQCGAFYIVKWSLNNIDLKLLAVENVMVESCAYGWLECLDLIKNHCKQHTFNLQPAMGEACNYGRLAIVEWLLQNVDYRCYNLPLLLQEAGRNGWIKIFRRLLKCHRFHISVIHIATGQALENGHLKIAVLVNKKIGKEGFDFSSLSKNAYIGKNKEGVVNFLLRNFNPKSIDTVTIMKNACLFGWKDIVAFIVDKHLSSPSDLSLAFNTACDNGELEIAKLLLEKVDHHILTVDKSMHSVAVKGWEEIATLLLEKFEPIKLNVGNALLEACRHGEIDVAQAILRKVDHNLLNIKTALNEACESHMHEELVLWILENIEQEHVDLKTVRKKAIRHNWWKVRIVTMDGDIEDLNQIEGENCTCCIVIS